jgi:hypothetical protein
MPLPDTRNARQKRLYRDTVDIYSIGGSMVDPMTKKVSDVDYLGTPTLTGVPCYYQSTSNINEPHVPGGTGEQNLLTDDSFHLEMQYANYIDEGTVVKLTTPGHPQAGTFFVAMGDARVVRGIDNRANQCSFLVTKTNAPNGVT